MGGLARLKLLLDTHIWLWSVLEPHRIHRNLARELSSEANECWISPISIWEALTLQRKGRVQMEGDLRTWLADSLKNVREAPLTNEIAIEAQFLNLHGNPADRFLAATAKVLDLTLVTADKNLLGLGDIATLANR
ncbi:MAG TPA: type II toxin-antitoxin system VapC family toxin [Candidatus Angelobacter sp.]|nr:type II toxin-antitoxin system VapC family toxin [Candidatus Angelobacter sp.]